ncbi:Bifunctional cytochrome P450/NADPH--P450 reductase [Penicillium rolfsii]|nr:Bifunctional cytochrome P450/NADPH--P450 reductase [Penicillium rolfsii]
MSSKIPQPPGIPILGNIFNVNPSETWNSLIKLAKDYGPIVKIKVLGKQVVFINSVELLEEICDERRFRKCVTGPIVEMRQCANDCLFTAYDNESSWGIAHRIMSSHVTEAGVDAYFDDMANVILDLTYKWTLTDKQPVLVTDDLNRLLMASVMQCFFNQRCEALRDPEPVLIPALERITMEAMKRPTRPTLLNRILYQKGFDNDIRIIRDFASDIIKRRRETPEESRNDLLGAMLTGTDRETGRCLNDRELVDEVVTMFIGAATSANLVSYALYYLMKNPDKRAKACEEIDLIIGSDQIQLDKLKKLKYCEAIIRESLRLSATAPGFNIEPIPTHNKNPVNLAGGKYEIPHNQVMIAVLHAVNRDPEVFEEPEAFNPERMLGEKWDNLPSAARKGFGNGKRECFGKVWAWRWSILTLVSILKDVSFEFQDPDYQLVSNGAFSVKPLGLYGLVSPRTKVT